MGYQFTVLQGEIFKLTVVVNSGKQHLVRIWDTKHVIENRDMDREPPERVRKEWNFVLDWRNRPSEEFILEIFYKDDRNGRSPFRVSLDREESTRQRALEPNGTVPSVIYPRATYYIDTDANEGNFTGAIATLVWENCRRANIRNIVRDVNQKPI